MLFIIRRLLSKCNKNRMTFRYWFYKNHWILSISSEYKFYYKAIVKSLKCTKNRIIFKNHSFENGFNERLPEQNTENKFKLKPFERLSQIKSLANTWHRHEIMCLPILSPSSPSSTLNLKQLNLVQLYCGN